MDSNNVEVDLCRQAFKNFDKYETGTIPKTVSTKNCFGSGGRVVDS